MIFLGCDPDSKGAVAILNKDGEPIEIRPALKGKEFFHAMIDSYLDSNAFMCIEKQISMGRDAHNSAFGNGYNYGQKVLVLDLLKERNCLFDYIEAHPATWKSSFKLSKDKTLSGKLCVDLWGESVKSLFTGARGAFMSGYAEALLLAYYGKLHYDRQLKLK